LELVTKKNLEEHHEPHGCTKCFEINLGYLETDEGPLVCKKCGGTVLLGLQSAFDYIGYLKHYYGADNNNES